jgi:hypothetical protein
MRFNNGCPGVSKRPNGRSDLILVYHGQLKSILRRWTAGAFTGLVGFVKLPLQTTKREKLERFHRNTERADWR